MNVNFVKMMGLIFLFVFPFSACSTVNSHTEAKHASEPDHQVAVGAANSTGIGLLTADSKDRQHKTLIEAGSGGLTGGSIAYYMDVQEAMLRKRLKGSGVGVTRLGNLIYLEIPDKMAFAARSFDIDTAFCDVLDTVAEVLNTYTKTTVDVIGHTDSVGSATYNQRASEKHARIIAEYLSGQGIASARLLMAGRGESQPVASNATPEGRNRNRRVNIQIAPLVAR